MKSSLFFLAALSALFVTIARSQYGTYEDEVIFRERNYAGPRLGVTVVPGDSKLSRKLKEKNMGILLSQFGWQFEYQVVPAGGGPSFVVEFIPLVSGVEYSKLIPGASLALGVRTPDGIEFGLGPNLLVNADGNLATALVMAVGKSFSYGGVNIPINLVYTTNPDGGRVSFMFGYAITKVSK